MQVNEQVGAGAYATVANQFSQSDLKCEEHSRQDRKVTAY
jgi:hypothetical protein